MRVYWGLMSLLFLSIFGYSVYLIEYDGDWTKLKYGIVSLLVSLFMIVITFRRR